MTDLFNRIAPADVRDLVAEYPLAPVVARATGEASLLPLLGEYDGEGRLTALIGHLGRHNPLHARLAERPPATILFTGPQAYVSTDHAERRDWGPTWNYAQLTVVTDVTFEPEHSGEALEAPVTAMEGERWSSEALGDRYAGMAARSSASTHR